MGKNSQLILAPEEREVCVNQEMILVFGLLAATVALFLSDRLRLDLVALLALLTLTLTGVLTPAEARAGFGDPLVLTIAGLFVVGAAIFQTGVADAVGRRLTGIAGTSETRAIAAIMGSWRCSPP